MTTAIEISELGMINDMRLLDMISHNLANANTPGYKRDIAVSGDFDRMLTDALSPLARRLNLVGDLLPPSVGMRADHSPGALRHTGNPLDLAIEGDAYFELAGEAGIRYSRLGSFGIDAGGRLGNSHGLVVRGIEGDIVLQGGNITIDRDGVIHEDGDYAGQLKLVEFDDPARLVKTGQGLWLAPGGVTARPASNAGLRQGYQEASNVRVMEEMVQMMATLRHFETTSRVIKGYDEMIGTAISTIAEF